MRTSDYSSPSVGNLVASWISLTEWTLWALAAKAQGMTDNATDSVKDAILDLGSDLAEGRLSRPVGVQPLPPLSSEQLLTALYGEIEQALRRTVEVINEDPTGCFAEVTRERVLAIFAELGHEVLEQALELRVAAAEAGLPPQSAHGEWVKKYRRMLAAEGRWPPAAEVRR